MTELKAVTAYVPKPLKASVMKAAKQSRMSVSEFLERLIETHLNPPPSPPPQGG